MDLKQIDKALSIFSSDDLNESQRLLHGRGKCFPGFEQLCIDWFSPVILITRFKSFDDFNLSETIKYLLHGFEIRFSQHSISAIVFQDRSTTQAIAKVCYGELPNECIAIEGSLQFHIDLLSFKNIGYFLDARHARNKLAELCENKRVLNLFAFTCAFSVVALANKAASVVNVDMGKGVLERGRDNHKLNKLPVNSRDVSYIKSDIFKAWKKLQQYGPYDIVVIDPPTLQKGSFNAAKDYGKIVKNLEKLLGNEATIIACLNSPFLGEAFLDDIFLNSSLNEEGNQLNKHMRIPNPCSFPESDAIAGLKTMQYSYKRVIHVSKAL